MIPDIGTLGSIADNVLESIPEGLSQGHLAAGLYGFGFLGRWALPRLKTQGINIVSCYDANAALKGPSADGVPIYPATAIQSARPDFVFIAARHAVKEVSAMLSDAGIRHVSYDAWHAASDFGAFRHIHDYVLGDDRSKMVLRAILMAMFKGDKSYCAAVFEKDQYFCLPQFCGSDKEIYVDAGAFVGDSAERFIWAHNGIFARIYAFEPGPTQFAALQARMRRLTEEWALDPATIVSVKAGLGETDCSLSAGSANEQLTSLAIRRNSEPTGVTVDIINLDSFLKGNRITFLKADVEGMEMALLKGAASSIRQHKPKIAICVYHYPADIPDITNYLATLVPAYRFAMRHHSPQLMETVLYCWTD